jgi:hypothetical protein
MKKFENSHVNTSGVFPDTLAVDASGPSATDGFEYIAEGINEELGWMQALLDETGVTPSGSTELAGPGLSDIVIGLKRLIGGEKIQPIDASLAANAMTVTLNPTYLDFRSATLGSGDVNNRILTAAINVVVSSGSTLGTVNGIQSRIAVLAIDNAGTVELAVVNLAGGNNLDETTRITTVAEGGAGAADAANVIYSTTVRTNVPFKVVGFIESTQATAGAWATNPSTIQGMGGNVDIGPKNAINTAKAWISFDGTGTPSINGSFNVSSITDNDTGDYTVNLTESMVDGSGCVVAGGNFGATLQNTTIEVISVSDSDYRVRYVLNTTATDLTGCYSAIFR